MKLSETVVNKYNILFREVAEYYGMSKEDLIVVPSIGLLYPVSLEWDMSISATISKNMKVLEKDYPYLKPFYKIFISMFSRTYQYAYIDSKTFIEINDIIKKIRRDTNFINVVW